MLQAMTVPIEPPARVVPTGSVVFGEYALVSASVPHTDERDRRNGEEVNSGDPHVLLLDWSSWTMCGHAASPRGRDVGLPGDAVVQRSMRSTVVWL